ncbi:unnamed protein product (macronuclear) [Paramecium tetraurelia]|uniref:Uncharacterized protein n=1 Tax=Paramecium tetraurelia TaxID=5888 RepID=A0C554_PARTE|nr:uncharacterized protein GSPATT00006420001 [Paramecium tetraurelia]CAK65921.1 unnamed protein product [Paramecium tetraurelia]|eukprot:XP_001433318.1 hypothetical protein (macronuclear) [Paramecium tetraurelia strain d4-2]
MNTEFLITSSIYICCQIFIIKTDIDYVICREKSAEQLNEVFINNLSMKVCNNASNSNNFKLRIFLKSQSKGESSSLYSILNSQKFVFGDDEKNHRTPRPLILYEDTSDRYKSTTSSSSSSHLRKLTQRIKQSTDSEINAENPISFYQILDNYNDQYLNLQLNKDRYYSQEKTTKKIKRLYTEQTEIETIKQKPFKQQQIYSQHQKTKKGLSVKQKLINSCKKNNKKLF